MATTTDTIRFLWIPEQSRLHFEELRASETEVDDFFELIPEARAIDSQPNEDLDSMPNIVIH